MCEAFWGYPCYDQSKFAEIQMETVADPARLTGAGGQAKCFLHDSSLHLLPPPVAGQVDEQVVTALKLKS